ncbi:TetR/AcrR family transcriptional regulator [Cellulomonas sp. zg-ZUI199]|uniref:TetR/AcrR family transcriptional regulator n=1 Tax=Cellulomonas wangleii TaxID=2816956 RepID=A0ABX8D8K7_9CELL|nr:TetR/AcrR family transcriptional regulator [Cellulomonas sp. zg-ZUI22]MBO0926314.1 TetR/AcrR family transcriptional regulator [Cellulomonas wangleii]QVI62816.1 TetR/AcrR family transcriptional regulator [Cellulomonas wangleii]
MGLSWWGGPGCSAPRAGAVPAARWCRGGRGARLTKRSVAPPTYGTLLRFRKGGARVTSSRPVPTEPSSAPRPRRVDARRNERALLDAAAAVFVASGVDAPVRAIAEAAGVGMGTVYRHFPTRADLVVAVYRHQVEACAQAAPALLRERPTPYAALLAWADLFVDFLVTKHGLAAAMRDDRPGFEAMHAFFLERLVPACDALLDAARAAGQVRGDVPAAGLLRGIGNLCASGGADPAYDARAMVRLLLAGLTVPDPAA